MADVQGVLKDPQFRALDPAGQRAVLSGLDPQFSSLSDSDFQHFMSQAAPAKQPHYIKQGMNAPPENDSSWLGRFAEGATRGLLSIAGGTTGQPQGPLNIPEGGGLLAPLAHPWETLKSLPSTMGNILTGDPETYGNLAAGAPFALMGSPMVPEGAGAGTVNALRGAARGAINAPKASVADLLGGGSVAELAGLGLAHTPWLGPAYTAGRYAYPMVKGAIQGVGDALRKPAVKAAAEPEPFTLTPPPGAPAPRQSPMFGVGESLDLHGLDADPFEALGFKIQPVGSKPAAQPATSPIEPVTQPIAQGGSPVPSNVDTFKHGAQYTDLLRQFHSTHPKGTSLRDIASKVYGTPAGAMPTYDQALKIHEYMLQNGRAPKPGDLK